MIQRSSWLVLGTLTTECSFWSLCWTVWALIPRSAPRVKADRGVWASAMTAKILRSWGRWELDAVAAWWSTWNYHKFSKWLLISLVDQQWRYWRLASQQNAAFILLTSSSSLGSSYNYYVWILIWALWKRAPLATFASVCSHQEFTVVMLSHVDISPVRICNNIAEICAISQVVCDHSSWSALTGLRIL